MTVRSYLVRGMVAGLLAGLLAFAFARLVGEPQVEAAERFEAAQAALQGEPEGEEVVSRAVQESAGLGAGAVVAGAAFGGLFGLAFAFAYRRVILAPGRLAAALLAAGAFVSVFLVPFVKYPGNPPGVGDPDTIGRRTTLYLVMLVVSVAALALAVRIRHLLVSRRGPGDATLTGLAVFVGVVALAYAVLPGIDEVPGSFPADLLWRFRLATIGVQAVLWTGIGVAFGILTERSERSYVRRHQPDLVGVGA